MKKFLVLVPLVLILAACLFGCTSKSTSPDTKNALFFDDFSQTNNSWTKLQDDTGTKGYDNNHYHIIIRRPDSMLIATAGKSFQDDVSIEMNKNGVLQMISPGANWLKMDEIKKGSETNHIHVDCIGDSLIMFDKGKQVSDSYDHSFVGGDVGVVARSSRLEGDVDIQFDNYIVNKPIQP